MSRRWLAKLTWGCFSVSTLLVACSKGGNSENGPVPISQEEFPARLAAIRCERMSSCCEGSGFPFDVASCEQKNTAAFQGQIVQYAANVDYDARAAGEFLDALVASNTCGRLVDPEMIVAWDGIFPGKIEPGQPCRSDQECRRESGHSAKCISESGMEPPVCRLVAENRHANVGEECSRTCFEDPSCLNAVPEPAPGSGAPEVPVASACYYTDGLWCDLGKETPTCSRLAPVGKGCSGPQTCVRETYCESSTQVCTARLGNGQPCLAGSDCESGYCKAEDLPPGSDPSTPIDAYCVAELPVTADDCRREYD